jgi:hypothetical protein
MTIMDVINFLYPDAIKSNLVMFRMPDAELLIAEWNIPNVPQPTEQELLDYGIEHERAITINALSLQATPMLQSIIDATAKAKSYENGISCASYANSTNVQWAAEAQAFIAWRDSVWSYAINLLATLQGNEEPIPSIEDVIAGMPQITWPEGA